MSINFEKDWTRFVISFIGLVMIFWILRQLSNLILPFVLALFMVMLLQPLLAFLIRKKFPRWLSVTLISILTLVLVAGFVSIISSTATQVADNSRELADKFSQRFEVLVDWVSSNTGDKIDSYQVKEFMIQPFSSDWLVRAFGDFAKFLGSTAGYFLMFSLYFIILLSGITSYKEYILHVFGKRNGAKFTKDFEVIMRSVSSYVGMKFLISFTTGAIFWGICSIFGIRFALFWGFLAFALNFIPSIGSIIATIPPILLGIIYIDSGGRILLFGILLIATQFIIGNILDPILMGNRMKLNTLTVILGLVFWGYIWGVAGMLLSVPLMVLLRILLEQNEDTAVVARAMSSTKKKKLAEVVAKD
ncbi:MAG TPA: AI-2E family transporter [candidate division Zixibacteria bacterium]|nr:AI-2E family transporter [candidate division Zixibacteria bacterium]